MTTPHALATRLGQVLAFSELPGDVGLRQRMFGPFEDRAHVEIDRAREETKMLQATLRQKQREASAIASQLETAVASARAAEHLATEHGARAKTLEQQLARMDGLPAALRAAQQALRAATQRQAALRAKLDDLTSDAKIKVCRVQILEFESWVRNLRQTLMVSHGDFRWICG